MYEVSCKGGKMKVVSKWSWCLVVGELYVVVGWGGMKLDRRGFLASYISSNYWRRLEELVSGLVLEPGYLDIWMVLLYFTSR